MLVGGWVIRFCKRYINCGAFTGKRSTIGRSAIKHNSENVSSFSYVRLLLF
jgi:hypothetical protein